MIIDQPTLQRLFDSIATDFAGTSKISTGSLLQSAYGRLAQQPDDAEAVNMVAVSLLHSGDAAHALTILQRHHGLSQTRAQSQRVAGYAALVSGSRSEGKRYLDEAVRLNPALSDCWTLLGRIAEQADQVDQAIAYYRRASIFRNANQEAVLALSRIYVQRHDLKEAIHTLRIALLHDRRSAELNLALAALLERRAAGMARRRQHAAHRRFLEEALRCYRIAGSAAPTAKTFVMQGMLQQRLEQFEAAKRSFQRAIELDPHCTPAATQLANASLESGDVAESLQRYEQVLQFSPADAAVHFRYSRAKRFKPSPQTDRYVATLNQLIAEPQRSRSDLVQLHFALAKVLDDVGRYGESWQHYDRANRFKRGHRRPIAVTIESRPVRPVERSPLQSVAEKSQRFFTKELFASHHGLGNPSTKPVFIVGMPRSGTTLTEQILSSHPAIAGAGELKWIERIRQQLITAVVGRALQMNLDAIDDLYPELLRSVDRSTFRQCADEYLAKLDEHCTGQSMVTDKMPTNFMHLGLIALMLPGATIIHCRRNPMDILVSCYCQNLNAPFCDLQQLTHYYQQYQQMMAHWQQVLPIKIHSVDYEALVTDPEPNVRAMIEHCGLPWDPRCLQFTDNRRAVHTPSKWQVRQPMYSTSIEKWRRFEPYLRDVAAELGQLPHADEQRMPISAPLRSTAA